MSLFEGQNLKGIVRNAELGPDSRNVMRVRWDIEVVDGEHKGKVAKYSGKLDPEKIKYTRRDMIMVGWQGKTASTFVADVKAASGKVIEFNAEIAEHDGRQWTSAKFGGGAPLGEMTSDKVNEVDRWFSEAGEAANDDRGIPF